MTMVETRSAVSRAPRPSSLADVLDLILDKGLVIDAYVRVSVAGIEVLTIDARVVIASVDTYLRFAEAVNRLDLGQTEEPGIMAFRRDSQRSDDSERPDSSERSSGSERSGNSRQLSDGGPKAEGRRESPSKDRDRKQPRGNDDEPQNAGLIDRLTERGRFQR